VDTCLKLFCVRCLAIPVVFFMLCLCGCGCDLGASPGGSDRLMVMTYNVQNLFDAYVTGNEYPEYTPEEGWTTDAYRKRLGRVAQAITQGHAMVPDIVLLQEIEHANVLQDLLHEHLSSRGFQWFAATAAKDSAIQVGIISRFPITDARTHSVQGNRPVLECEIDLGSEKLVVFVVHAKSRREGVAETEGQRIATSGVISRRTEELLRKHPWRPVLVAGDFNGSADSYLREGATYQTALVPFDVLKADDYARNGSLLVSGGVPPRGIWYTWWLDRSQLLLSHADGSYWYQGIWETFDQILLSPAFFDSYGLEFHSGQVGVGQHLRDEKGHPNAWNVRTESGYSDHLPVYVVLTGR